MGRNNVSPFRQKLLERARPKRLVTIAAMDGFELEVRAIPVGKQVELGNLSEEITGSRDPVPLLFNFFQDTVFDPESGDPAFDSEDTVRLFALPVLLEIQEHVADVSGMTEAAREEGKDESAPTDDSGTPSLSIESSTAPEEPSSSGSTE